MHKIKKEILRKLMHSPKLSFNDLWDKVGESNLFAYHLRVLEEDNFVVKEDSKYSLSSSGKKYSAYVSGATGDINQAPVLGVICVIYDEVKDKFLLMERLKEPFYGYWGFHGGKLKSSQYILECARAEIKEETGLTCDLELKGLFSFKTYNDEVFTYNHQMFVIKATNPVGTTLTSTREGKNQWLELEQISSLKTFPNVRQSIEIALGNGFEWIEAERKQVSHQFSGMNILSRKRFGE